jgi:hypothetical protein
MSLARIFRVLNFAACAVFGGRNPIRPIHVLVTP